MLNIKKPIHQRIKKWAQKTKTKYEYIRIWLTNLKIKKERNRTFVLAIEVLICSRAQRLLICFKTFFFWIGWYVLKHWRQQPWTLLGKRIRSIKDKYYNNKKPNCKVEEILGLLISSTATMPTTCIKINKSNTYFINNNYKAQHFDFPLNEPLNLGKKR